MFQWCFGRVPWDLRGCFSDVPVMFQGCSRGVALMFRSYSSDVPVKFRSCSDDVPVLFWGVRVLFQRVSGGLLDVFLWCSIGVIAGMFSDVPVVFWWWFKWWYWLSSDVPWCSSDDLVMFSWYSSDVPVMFQWCSGDVPVVFQWCSGLMFRWCPRGVLVTLWSRYGGFPILLLTGYSNGISIVLRRCSSDVPGCSGGE